MAATASGHAGGSAGMSEMDRTRPVVEAQAAWPRTTASWPGRAGSAPSTSAARSSGTDAMGSTRPCAPSSLPTQSSP